MKRILYLFIGFTVVVACVFIFASCTSQNNESDYDTHDTPHYYENEISDNATHDANDDFEIIEYDFVAGWWGNNPWRADYNLEYMPVFRNHFHMRPVEVYEGIYAQGRYAKMLSDDEMIEMAKNIILAMGFDVEGANIFYPPARSNGDLRWLTVVSENVEVTVERNSSVQILFREGLALSDGMVFPWWDQPQDEAIDYLTERFAAILGVEIKTFENNHDDIVERMLDYFFNNIHFGPHFDGGLHSIARPPLMELTLSDKIGYFPIITPEEAIELMLLDQGVWPFRIENESVPTRDYIIDIQLVYFGHNLALPLVEAFIPWYSILFISPVWGDYTHYFVPAIRTDYLEANPGWFVFPHQ